LSDVHIVALGARTPVGLCAESSAAAIRARISRVQEHPFLVDLRGEPVRLGLDGRLDPARLGVPRMVEMATWALREVQEKLGAAWAAQREVDIALNLPEPRAGFAESNAREVMDAIVADAPLGQLRIAPHLRGRAGALEALVNATSAIRSGRRHLLIVGGVDSYVDPDTLLALNASGRLAADTVRGGFPPGEAACFVALGGDQALQHWGLPSLARIAGAAAAVEEKRSHDGALNLGEALTRAIRDAAAELSSRRQAVESIYCDINGEREQTEEWGFAVLRTKQLWKSASRYRTAVAECGDVGAATGPLLLILAVQAGLREQARGPALAWAASDCGLRAASLVLPEMQG
jgi:3-oxoacyl-[acyl-carrier-protein] synthase I